MPEIFAKITEMTVEEKIQTMEFLWSHLSTHYATETPEWHEAALAERADASDDEFEDWEDVKTELRSPSYAR